MVSKESFKKVILKEQKWIDTHPQASTSERVKHRLTNMPTFINDVFELKFSKATILSTLAPIPSSQIPVIDEKMNRAIDRFKRRLR